MIWLVLVSVLVGLGRLTVPGHGLSWPGTYEALAHVWVGVLLAMAADWNSASLSRSRRARLAGLLLAVLTVLETVCFLLR